MPNGLHVIVWLCGRDRLVKFQRHRAGNEVLVRIHVAPSQIPGFSKSIDYVLLESGSPPFFGDKGRFDKRGCSGALIPQMPARAGTEYGRSENSRRLPKRLQSASSRCRLRGGLPSVKHWSSNSSSWSVLCCSSSPRTCSKILNANTPKKAPTEIPAMSRFRTRSFLSAPPDDSSRGKWPRHIPNAACVAYPED